MVYFIRLRVVVEKVWSDSGQDYELTLCAL